MTGRRAERPALRASAWKAAPSRQHVLRSATVHVSSCRRGGMGERACGRRAPPLRGHLAVVLGGALMRASGRASISSGEDPAVFQSRRRGGADKTSTPPEGPQAIARWTGMRARAPHRAKVLAGGGHRGKVVPRLAPRDIPLEPRRRERHSCRTQVSTSAERRGRGRDGARQRAALAWPRWLPCCASPQLHGSTSRDYA